MLEKGKTWTEEEALQYFLFNQPDIDKNMVLVSSVKKWGLTGLLQYISTILVDKTGFQA